MITLLKEPLLHFLFLGFALFVIFEQVSDYGFSGAGQVEEIVVTEGRIQALQLKMDQGSASKADFAEHHALVSSLSKLGTGNA